jgi:phospholipid transport system substrate-binding protein
MSDSNDRMRVTRRRVLLLGLGGFTLLGGVHAAHALTSVEKYIAGLGNEVIRLANSGNAKLAMRRRFSALVSRNANVRSVALLALGPYQKQIPSGQREEFFRLVSDYIAAFFVYYLKDFQGTGLEIKSSAQQGRSTIVESMISFDGRSDVEVRWRVTSGRISDIKVRGIWLSLQLKKRFTDILRRTKGDFGPLFAELKSAETW